jgi:hypothetical protein
MTIPSLIPLEPNSRAAKPRKHSKKTSSCATHRHRLVFPLEQALDAKGAKGEAVRTLKACMKHPDRDVRRVAEGLEFIMVMTSP